MKKLITNTVFALIGLVMLAFTANVSAQSDTPSPGTPCITMTVTKNAQVKIDMRAAVANTTVWVETAPGTYTQVTVDTDGTGYKYYTADGTTIKVHGNLKGIDCDRNGTKLTGLAFSSGLTNLKELDCHSNQLSSLDVSALTNLTKLWCHDNQLSSLEVSGLTNLTELRCYGNPFSTKAIDNIYCALPEQTAGSEGILYIANTDSDANISAIKASNAKNARDKSWKVWYYGNFSGFLHDKNVSTNGSYVCGYTPPVGTPCITMTVTKGSTVQIDMRAAADNTTVWVETKSNTYTQATVGTSWTGSTDYTATGTTIKVHGDLAGFSCSDNTTKLTGLSFSGLTDLTVLYCYNNQLSSLEVSALTSLNRLYCSGNQLSSLEVSALTNLETLSCGGNQLSSLDVSALTNLTTLWCYGNPFSTQAIDDIYCALPLRTAGNAGKLYIANTTSDANISAIKASSAPNARAKYWKVWYYDNFSGSLHDTDVSTNSGYVCGSTPPIGTPYITLTVTPSAQVQIDMQAAAANTTVWVETSPGNYTPVTVGTSWTGYVNYTATDTTIKVHGKLKGFDCNKNYTKLTGLAFSSGLTNLQDLYCSKNSLTALDVSGLTNLKRLYCLSNSLTTLNVRWLTNLQDLRCGYNFLTALDVSWLTNLEVLYCDNNSLTTLNVIGLTKLYLLYCHNNSLTALDVSWLTKLTDLSCFDNDFTTQAIDDIYCALPQRKASDNAVIYPVYRSSSADNATVMATNKQNATNKSWKVQYYNDNTYVPATTGTYVCGTPYAGTPTITMTVTENAKVKIRMWAAAANTPVWIETEAGTYKRVMVGTHWTDFVNYTATGTTIKVHGNLQRFDCDGNSSKLTGLTFSSGLTNLKKLSCNNNSLTTLDVSGLTNLEDLSCGYNSLTTLNISGLTNLKKLYCGYNPLTTLNISGLTNLKKLDCNDNSLTTLDVSGLTNMETLYCFNNSLTTLNVSGLTNLKNLACNDNSLTTLNVSGLTNLENLDCYNNNFSTQAIDGIYCALPLRTAGNEGTLFIANTDSDANIAAIAASNAKNARDKYWKVRYFDNLNGPLHNKDVTTNGGYVCGTGIADVVAAEQLSIYPNPAKEMVTVELNESYTGLLQITDISGKILISHKINGTRTSVDISALSKGIYLVKVGSQINKLIVK